MYRYNIPLSNGKNYTFIEFNKVRSDHTNDQYWRFTFNNYSQICKKCSNIFAYIQFFFASVSLPFICCCCYIWFRTSCTTFENLASQTGLKMEKIKKSNVGGREKTLEINLGAVHKWCHPSYEIFDPSLSFVTHFTK